MGFKLLSGNAPEQLQKQYAYPALVNESYVRMLIPAGINAKMCIRDRVKALCLSIGAEETTCCSPTSVLTVLRSTEPKTVSIRHYLHI